MGYYVEIMWSNARIPANKLDEAYRRMCALNTTHHDQKRGGRFGKDFDKNDPSNSWFSWMPWNYPEVLSSAEAILDCLGFETESDEFKLSIRDFGDKAGQENLFLESIADLFIPGSCIQWIGEDGSIWCDTFDGSTAIKRTAGRYVSEAVS